MGAWSGQEGSRKRKANDTASNQAKQHRITESRRENCGLIYDGATDYLIALVF